MPEPNEKDIMNRAYEIWERNGRPEGREDDFWHQAVEELRNEAHQEYLNRSHEEEMSDLLERWMGVRKSPASSLERGDRLHV